MRPQEVGEVGKVMLCKTVQFSVTDSPGDVQVFPFPAVIDTFVPAVGFFGKGQGDIYTDRKDYHGPYWTENI